MPPRDEGLDVGDRVPVDLIGTDVKRGFIDFARAGRRPNPDSSVLPPQLSSCFRTYVPLVPMVEGPSDMKLGIQPEEGRNNLT